MTATGTIARPTSSAAGRPIPRHVASHRTGFWLVTYAFAVVMALGALPTPLYALYERRDQFSSIDVTLVFAAYAVGVVLSLCLVGHVSDWVGRRRMLLAAVGLSLVSGAVFLTWTGFLALLVARLVSGLGVGIVTTTATAHLGELYAQRHPDGSSRRAEIVAAAANLGGLGLGPLLAGLLAQFAPDPLRTPYLVSIVLLVGAGIALTVTPETVRRAPATPYRPQQLLIPATSRRTFAAAAVGAAVTFTVFGTFSALVPGFLAGTLHNGSHAVAGAVTSAVFLAAAIAQVVASRIRIDPARAAVTAAGGLTLLAIASWSASLLLFVLGAVITGAGVGALFKSMLGAVVVLAPPGHRGEVLATFFLAAYLGLALPVVALGALAQLLSTAVLMTAFAATASVALVAAAHTLRHPSEQTDATTTALRRQPRVNWLRDVILGGQDGLVNILGIVLGVIAGGGSRTVLLAAGFAAAITESISMGAVGYTSTSSDRDYYRSVHDHESDAVATQPDAERDRVRALYAAKGFTGTLLDEVVATITAHRDRWVASIMDDELHLQPVHTRDALRSSVVITFATLIGHLIPLLPFLWLATAPAVVTAIGLSAAVLFSVGAYSAVSLTGDWRRSGLKMVAIGLGAAAVGFAIGHLFQAGA